MIENNFVVVRTRGAGVHCGFLDEKIGPQHFKLRDARRIYRWRGANTLNEVANNGCAKDWTRISEPVQVIELTTVIEIIPCTSKAQENLCQSRWGA